MGRFTFTRNDFGDVFSFQELQSDVVLRKKNVDQAVSNGMELLKQTTGTSDFMT